MIVEIMYKQSYGQAVPLYQNEKLNPTIILFMLACKGEGKS